MGRDSSTSLAPGFRFHPTDEEIVRYYLRRKVSGKSIGFDAISVTDIYKSEPWDLPEKSKLRTRDLEWYFFSPLDKKYGNSLRTNRATENGYWKTTGKDREVRHNSRVLGMKKTLVYHRGRAPRGTRSNWVMHEYRLTDEDLERSGVVLDAFVLCRIFQKSGSGPKNGEQYGAPFIEEEWDDDEELTLPGEEVVVNERLVDVVDDDMHLEVADIAQYFDGGLPFQCDRFPSNYPQDASNPVELPNVLVENDNKPEEYVGDTLQFQHSLESFQLPEQYGIGGTSGKDECFAESSNVLAESSDNLKDEYIDYLLDEPYPDDLALNEESFIEANDLSNPVETDLIDFDVLDYLTFFDADDNFQLSFDPNELLGSEEPKSSQTIPEAFSEQIANGEAENDFIATKQTFVASIKDASTSKQTPVANETDSKLPFLERASYLLGDFPAPPAFASEYPSKEMAIRLNSATGQTSSSVHMTTGMIHIRNLTSNGDVVNSLYGKNADVNLILSLARHQHQGESDEMISQFGAQSPKNGIMGTWGGFLFFFLLFWVLILSVSYKVGSCIYSH